MVSVCVWLYICHPRSLNRNLTIVIHKGCEHFAQKSMHVDDPSWLQIFPHERTSRKEGQGADRFLQKILHLDVTAS